MNQLRVRAAVPDEAGEIEGILDRSLLSFDRAKLREGCRGDSVLVADSVGRIRGVALLAGGHIRAVAVDHRDRNQGVGRALVREIRARHPTVTATCDRQVAPFYEALGFSQYELPNGRVFCYSRQSH